jgi:hypothetical protein
MSDWTSRNWYNVYGRIAKHAPIVMTEEKGGCSDPPWPSGWSTWPADFTAMLGYNYATNIGVTAWVFDDLTDEIGSIITTLGSPNPYTNPWRWAASNCSTSQPTTDWTGTDKFGPG